MPKAKEDPRPRDREATEKAILAAAKAVLAEDGFQAFGVNAIARRAGCDKQLIYRYFGGLDGLTAAIGVALADELTAALAPYSAPPRPTTYAELMARLATGLIALMRGNTLMQQINAWEAAAPDPLVKPLIAARAKRMGLWMHQMRGDLMPPEGVDAPAVNAVLIAAIQQLTLSASANGEFSGLPLRSEADWERAGKVIRALIDAVYAR